VEIAEDKLNMLMNVLPRLFGERLLCWSVNAVSELGYLTCWVGLILNRKSRKWTSLFARDRSSVIWTKHKIVMWKHSLVL